MILNSLVMTGEKAINGTLDTSEQTYYLNKLNSMMESWSLERLMCYAIFQESFSLTASDGEYTIGVSTGDFNTVRPNKIVKAFTRDSANMDSALIILGFDAYDSIVMKSTGTTYPNYLFYDGAYPLGTIKLYPTPIAGLTLYLDSWKQLQTFANLSTALALPPGYQRAIETNFAIEAAPGFGSIQPELAKIAKESKAAIKSLNVPDTIMSTGLYGSRRSILTGP